MSSDEESRRRLELKGDRLYFMVQFRKYVEAAPSGCRCNCYLGGLYDMIPVAIEREYYRPSTQHRKLYGEDVYAIGFDTMQ